ncbi:unnamed protein product [Prorocentrum cordatum]|nr:unnamed protein product [Polarella glacialis]
MDPSVVVHTMEARCSAERQWNFVLNATVPRVQVGGRVVRRVPLFGESVADYMCTKTAKCLVDTALFYPSGFRVSLSSTLACANGTAGLVIDPGAVEPAHARLRESGQFSGLEAWLASQGMRYVNGRLPWVLKRSFPRQAAACRGAAPAALRWRQPAPGARRPGRRGPCGGRGSAVVPCGRPPLSRPRCRCPPAGPARGRCRADGGAPGLRPPVTLLAGPPRRREAQWAPRLAAEPGGRPSVQLAGTGPLHGARGGKRWPRRRPGLRAWPRRVFWQGRGGAGRPFGCGTWRPSAQMGSSPASHGPRPEFTHRRRGPRGRCAPISC